MEQTQPHYPGLSLGSYYLSLPGRCPAWWASVGPQRRSPPTHIDPGTPAGSSSWVLSLSTSSSQSHPCVILIYVYEECYTSISSLCGAATELLPLTACNVLVPCTSPLLRDGLSVPLQFGGFLSLISHELLLGISSAFRFKMDWVPGGPRAVVWSTQQQLSHRGECTALGMAQKHSRHLLPWRHLPF